MTSEWLGDLEDKVRDAAEELRRLRDENGELRERLERMTLQAEAPGEGDEAWSRERDEIRQRVERLVGELEALLEE